MVNYRLMYFRPLPWMGEQYLIGVMIGDGDIYSRDLETLRAHLSRSTFECMLSYSAGADGPHLRVGPWCHGNYRQICSVIGIYTS